MFSRRVATHSFEELNDALFDQIRDELESSQYAGDRMTAKNMAMNWDKRAYYGMTEYIQFDEPEMVINAIREVYDQVGRPRVQR